MSSEEMTFSPSNSRPGRVFTAEPVEIRTFFGFELLLAVFGLYLYLLGLDEAADTVVDGDLVLLHQALHAAPELADDLLATLCGLRVVELHLADLDPVLLAVSGVVQEMGRVEQRLGRDAAQVQARPSEMPALPLLDEGHAHPQLAGPDRRYVPCRFRRRLPRGRTFQPPLAPFSLGFRLRSGHDLCQQPLPDACSLNASYSILTARPPRTILPLARRTEVRRPPAYLFPNHLASTPRQGCPCFSKTRR